MTANLGVGDQIVIEVVDLVGERESEPLHCDFCGRDVTEVSTLVQGSAGSICDQCITEFSTAVHQGHTLPLGASFRDDSEVSCRFCGQAPPVIGPVVMRNGAAVCGECLRTGADILSDRQ
jgi:ATP-dependent protease Clp ATPase subunit